jgi:hypothetical protein
MALSLSFPTYADNSFTSKTISAEEVLIYIDESDLTGKANYVLSYTLNIQGVTIGTFYAFPDSSGKMTLDLTNIVRDYIKKNKRTWVEVAITYSATWDGGGYSVSIYIFWVLNGRRSKQRPVNMIDHILKDSYTLGLSAKQAKWCTMFQEPRYWIGWDNYISIFVQDSFVLDCNIVTHYYYLAKTIATGNTTSISGFVGDSFLFILPLAGFVYPNIRYLKTFIEQDSNSGLITDEIWHRICDPGDNPMMVQWPGRNGGLEQFLFNIEQEFILTEENTSRYKIVSNVRNVVIKEDEAIIEGEGRELITVKADKLTLNELQALHTIKEAPYIRLWLDTLGQEFVYVTLQDITSTDYTTGKHFFEFQATFRMPANTYFHEIKEY